MPPQSQNNPVRGAIFQARKILKALISDSNRPIPMINAIRQHNKRETPKHMAAKALLSKALMDQGEMIVSEFPIAGGECDVFTVFSRHVHELETVKSDRITKKKKEQYLGPESQVNDLFIWYLEDVPDDVIGMYEYFKERI